MDKPIHQNVMNMGEEMCSKNEESQIYPDEDNITINILNDDCLAHMFSFLPIADRLRSERGEYST